MEKKHYPTAFLLVIALALYFMYGDMFSLKNIDFSAYQKVCVKYKNAKKEEFSKSEIQSLINKINYILPDEVSKIEDPLKKELKNCANSLSIKLSAK